MQVKLKILKGSRKEKLLPIQGEKLLIGRGEECDLRPRSESVSRKHSVITITDSQVTIRDLESKNGTFVNGERITGSRGLQDGDQLRIGPMEFELQIDSQAHVKRPKVQGVADVVERTAADPTGSVTDFDIGSWLDEADQEELARRMADPETRQFKLDDTDRVPINEDAQANSDTAVDKPESAAGAKPEFDKNSGKLPRVSKEQTKDSREAAQQMLKKFFTK